ncbi:MFS transporter [Nocardioides sp. TRM66260-LWL]|uniref:MFS transporter n=1 Tax=Nocardioides sp. TRM66260-LWL TaxID=2874478 RepID=UPI001CC5CCA8|nr:MFS transporter [Nocardioides sp. TRM66260-LWL]MBZ5734762.1 MFS transporter [Nocardioides sp. TRM66260-LWL]
MSDQTQVPEQRGRGIVLAVLSAAAFVASLDLFIVNVAFEQIGADLDASLADLSWVLNAYAILYAALLVPAGRLADRYGRKGAFLAGLALFTLASVACAAAPDVWTLVAARAVQALGAAVLTPASLGLVVAAAPPERRAAWIRTWAATGALAAAFGPAVGGVLVEASWQWVFLVNVPIGLAALVVAALVVEPSRDDAATRLPDLLGAAALAISVGALTLALVEGDPWGWGSARVVGAFVVAALALVAFVASSARHAEPVIDPALLRVPAFRWSNVTSLLFAAPFAAALLVSVLWLQLVWGYSPIRTGLAIAPGPLMVPVFAAVAHRLTARVPVGWVVALGCVLFAAGTLLTAASVTTEPAYATTLMPGWLIGGAGVGLALPNILSSATADLPPSRAATGSAVVAMTRQLGTAFGVTLVVVLLGTPAPGEVLDAFHRVWWALAGVMLLAAVSAPLLTPGRRSAPAVAAPVAA